MTGSETTGKRTTAVSLDPDEPGQYRPDDGHADTAASARVRFLYGETLLHRQHDLYVAADKGHGKELQTFIRTRLQAERFSLDDADEWAYRHWYRWLVPMGESYNDEIDPWLCDQVVEAALAYRDAGIPNDEAFAWTIRGVSVTDATRIRAYGWNPHASSTLLSLCLLMAPDIDDANEWVESPIVWWRALRYLQAGIRLPEARDHETRRLVGDDVDGAIDLLIALTAREMT